MFSPDLQVLTRIRKSLHQESLVDYPGNPAILPVVGNVPDKGVQLAYRIVQRPVPPDYDTLRQLVQLLLYSLSHKTGCGYVLEANLVDPHSISSLKERGHTSSVS